MASPEWIVPAVLLGLAVAGLALGRGQDARKPRRPVCPVCRSPRCTKEIR